MNTLFKFALAIIILATCLYMAYWLAALCFVSLVVFVIYKLLSTKLSVKDKEKPML